LSTNDPKFGWLSPFQTLPNQGYSMLIGIRGSSGDESNNTIRTRAFAIQVGTPEVVLPSVTFKVRKSSRREHWFEHVPAEASSNRLIFTDREFKLPSSRYVGQVIVANASERHFYDKPRIPYKCFAGSINTLRHGRINPALRLTRSGRPNLIFAHLIFRLFDFFSCAPPPKRLHRRM
jgi:hypothetical protein